MQNLKAIILSYAIPNNCLCSFQSSGKPLRSLETVIDYREEFHSLAEAKKAMNANNAKGFITKVWRNGDWENCGEITLKGQNKTFIANTKQQNKNY